MAYAVSQRTTEIGVRMALGATPFEVFGLVVGDGLKLAALGIALGVAGSVLTGRWLTSLLFGVRATDPLTLGDNRLGAAAGGHRRVFLAGTAGNAGRPDGRVAGRIAAGSGVSPYNFKKPSVSHARLREEVNCSWRFSHAQVEPARDADTLIPDTALAPNSLIGLRNIEKSYAHGTSRTYVLRRINVDVKEGEFVSIMGPSGAGKSTLLHIIGMHDSAWTGEYYFLDQPVHKLAAKERAKLHKQYIGFVFQSYHLLDHLTVYENLDIPLSYRDIRKSERESMVCDILDRFAIVGKKDLYPNQLSGGQQQLVAVARAVISNPKLILADEPTGNLHTSQGKEIMELFKKLNETGTTIIQVTHSETNAGYGSRIIQLRDGWVVEE